MIVWLDGMAGASGDMLLGALVDAGVPLEVVQAPIDRLDLGIVLRVEPVTRASLGALRVHVDVPVTRTMRHLDDIERLFEVLDDPVRSMAIAVFRRLAHAEAAVHRTSLADVHFHEVGALDSIADVVGVCAGVDHLRSVVGVSAICCSTLSLGSGTTRGAHGPIPVPAPAVLHLLPRVPVQAGPARFEATTPTGAALLAEFVSTWGPMPPMTIDRVGIGAGSKDADEVANAVRIVVGRELAERRDGETTEVRELVQLDANVDDMDPRVWPVAIDAVLAAGALDAWVVPIVMKKGRPAHTFSALTDRARLDDVRRAVFVQTSTIGVREHAVERHALERSSATIEVDGQPIRVKRSMLDGEVATTSVEWDDVVAAAAVLDRSPHDVLDAARRHL
ncbi:MAG: nickel pincer cofactor biosynthesis protein LarC [Ilumatobacter sp.]|uniref:nickel pincer cofactor biosynthesis protein LarC n=1 Tax=Ilumatobacter sp. TaxID=1967498 RepID=UPI00391B97CF